jgi:multiple sugar transport system permease protein
VDSTLLTEKPPSSTVSSGAKARARFLAGHQGRQTREAILAYLFLFPAFLIVGLFGLFPLLFSAYQSTLSGLNKIVGTYVGLGNYVRAIDSLAYVLFFWIAAILVYLGIGGVVQAVVTARARRENAWPWALPGVVIGVSLALFVLFIFRILPQLLSISSQLRGRNNTPEMFRTLVGEAWRMPSVQQAWWAALLTLAAGLALLYYVRRRYSRGHAPGDYSGAFIGVTVMLLLAAFLTWLTWTSVRDAYTEALEQGQPLELWSQIVTISAGFLLLLAAWQLWESAAKRDSNIGMIFRLAAAAMLLVGAWFLIGELPRVFAAGDESWWLGLLSTFYYALGTIPAQLILALLLATLLFQELKGKSVFRMIFFIPYIAPFVGTAAVFRIIFSQRPESPMNQFLGALGLDPLRWLNEPTGIFQMIVGPSVELPVWAAGPSLALIVIIIYGTWTFVGFNTVIFLAGLGNIPREVYEAGAIDGAGRWALFRHITLPMLSPTIYFITLYSVIGTFKAFNHIYVLRTAAALGTTDTASVVIFQTLRENVRYGYASALAILLLVIILILTAINNRIASERVFYG